MKVKAIVVCFVLSFGFAPLIPASGSDWPVVPIAAAGGWGVVEDPLPVTSATAGACVHSAVIRFGMPTTTPLSAFPSAWTEARSTCAGTGFTLVGMSSHIWRNRGGVNTNLSNNSCAGATSCISPTISLQSGDIVWLFSSTTWEADSGAAWSPYNTEACRLAPSNPQRLICEADSMAFPIP